MNKQTKKLVKAFILIYIASFLIINWADVSWIFNYKEVTGLVYDFFNPYPSIDASSIGGYFHPNNSQARIKNQNQLQAVEQIKTAYTDKQNTLEIPKIAISAPIIFSRSSDKTSLTKDLNMGVVYYPGSVKPGEKGEIVILGHSAPAGWPKTKYNWVFSDLEDLSIGDTIFIDANNKQYKYVVKSRAIIQRGEEANSSGLGTNNTLILISCWPPGKDLQRIVVRAELVDNIFKSTNIK